jgi:hypothetical protein
MKFVYFITFIIALVFFTMPTVSAFGEIGESHIVKTIEPTHEVVSHPMFVWYYPWTWINIIRITTPNSTTNRINVSSFIPSNGTMVL